MPRYRSGKNIGIPKRSGSRITGPYILIFITHTVHILSKPVNVEHYPTQCNRAQVLAVLSAAHTPNTLRQRFPNGPPNTEGALYRPLSWKDG